MGAMARHGQRPRGTGASAPRRAPLEGDVRSMFDEIVDRYDLLNGVLSMGLDRGWRHAAARAIPILGPNDRVLDLGCGTGKLGALLAGRARVTGLDVSREMLARARRTNGNRLMLVQGSAFALPFEDAAFAGAVSGFVLRNLDDLMKAFSELARVLRAGGHVALVDITEPRPPLLRKAFDAYFGAVAPALGALVGKRDAYRYLVRSLAQLPPQDEVCELLNGSGFVGSRARPLTGGMVTLFEATRAR
jgi:demethylmenaquinone methyltransferase/2-methoxy-6-polyprenyl-1,4-benzoquinol methylase